MIALMFLMFDERFDLLLKVAGQQVVSQQDAVFERLVPALDLALCLGMHRCAGHIAHLVGFDIFRQFTRDIAGTIVAE